MASGELNNNFSSRWWQELFEYSYNIAAGVPGAAAGDAESRSADAHHAAAHHEASLVGAASIKAAASSIHDAWFSVHEDFPVHWSHGR